MIKIIFIFEIAGGITQALLPAQRTAPHLLKIEVEC